MNSSGNKYIGQEKNVAQGRALGNAGIEGTEGGSKQRKQGKIGQRGEKPRVYSKEANGGQGFGTNRVLTRVQGCKELHEAWQDSIAFGSQKVMLSSESRFQEW